MKRLSICAVAFLDCAVFALSAMEALLLTSTLVVQVLSVDQVSYSQEPGPKERGQVLYSYDVTGYLGRELRIESATVRSTRNVAKAPEPLQCRITALV
jgi:hypothetical protein